MKTHFASEVLLIKPQFFGNNPETAVDNYFSATADQFAEIINQKGCKEHDKLAALLEEFGVTVHIAEDTVSPQKPDALFPTWLTTHENGKVVKYPLKAKNRHPEKRDEVFDVLKTAGFDINEIVDYSHYEKEGKFLEGSGSMVLDREHRFAFACLSSRTDEEVVKQFCKDFEYEPILFKGYQEMNDKLHPIYYTNVMMCIADNFCLFAKDAITDKLEQRRVMEVLESTGREIIEMSAEQTRAFLGNAAVLRNNKNQLVMVMSKKAYHMASPDMIKKISEQALIAQADLTTLETFGGGSARSAIGEVFLPKK